MSAEGGKLQGGRGAGLRDGGDVCGGGLVEDACLSLR